MIISVVNLEPLIYDKLVQAVSRDSSALEHSLAKLDSFLSRLPSSFLCGDTLSHLDCEILPKLHHHRVAAGVLKVNLIKKLFLMI